MLLSVLMFGCVVFLLAFYVVCSYLHCFVAVLFVVLRCCCFDADACCYHSAAAVAVVTAVAAFVAVAVAVTVAAAAVAVAVAVAPVAVAVAVAVAVLMQQHPFVVCHATYAFVRHQSV